MVLSVTTLIPEVLASFSDDPCTQYQIPVFIPTTLSEWCTSVTLVVHKLMSDPRLVGVAKHDYCNRHAEVT